MNVDILFFHIVSIAIVHENVFVRDGYCIDTPIDIMLNFSLKDTINGFKAILVGEFDALPEQAFYMAGGIDEAAE
ncbi:MAG: hypothetical protein V7784_00770 [Oceanospirillaceae bacterium]